MLLKIQMMLESTTERKYISRFIQYTKYKRKKHCLPKKCSMAYSKVNLRPYILHIVFSFSKVYNFL